MPVTQRYQLIDILRGVAIVLMVYYHFSYDLTHFGYAGFDFYHDPYWLHLRTFIVSLFLGLVGVSLVLASNHGINWQRYARRLGLLIFFALGIPFFFNPFGTLGGLEKALGDGKTIIVSLGKILDPKAGTWGHVVLVVGATDSAFLLLDPAEREGVSRRDKRAFINDWWYTPVHPCWVIG